MTTSTKTPRRPRVVVFPQGSEWRIKFVAANGKTWLTSSADDAWNRKDRAVAVAQKLSGDLDVVVED